MGVAVSDEVGVGVGSGGSAMVGVEVATASEAGVDDN
jgi:hypothetical protein